MATGRGEVGAIPEADKRDAKAAHEALVELVAEGKDELMEEFFAEGTIPEEHLIAALHEAIREDRIFPVSVCKRVEKCGDGSSTGFSEGVCACTNGAGAGRGAWDFALDARHSQWKRSWMFRTRSSCARWAMRSRSRSMCTRR